MDLASRLQNALLQQQVRLHPIDSQPSLDYVTSILFEEDEKEESEMMDFCLETSNTSYRNLLTELSSIISASQQQQQQDHVVLKGKDSIYGVHSMLLECARAVASNNVMEVYRKVDTIQRCLPPSSSSYTFATHFVRALIARLTGSGLPAHKALEAVSIKQYSHLCTHIPTNKVTYLFGSEMISERCKGAKHVHIVDYGIHRGHQWPRLIREFAERTEGPPSIKITGIEFPHVECLDIGNKLMQYARFLGVHLVYKSIASHSWETVNVVCEGNEVLIVNCNLRMRHLKHDGTSINSQRNMLLTKIHSLRPAMFLLSDVSADFNNPFFLPRFQEALRYYSACTEYYSAYVKEQVKPVLDGLLASKIMNVIACEGLDRYERATSYTSWESAVLNAGFEQVPLSSAVYSKVRNFLSQFPHSQELGTAADRSWLLVGWKDVILYAMCAWQPRAVS